MNRNRFGNKLSSLHSCPIAVLAFLLGTLATTLGLGTTTNFTPSFIVTYWNTHPVVSECIFTMTNNLQRSAASSQSTNAGQARLNVPYYFFGRFQSNAFALTSFQTGDPSFEALEKTANAFRPSFGRWGKEHWYAHAPGQVTTAVDADGNLNRDPRMSVSFAYENTLLDVLNLGVPTLKRGSALLDEDGVHFSAIRMDGNAIRGTFVVNQSRQVKSIIYRMGKMSSHFEVLFAPSSARLAGLPESITVKYISEDNPVRVTHYVVDRMRFESEALPRSAFELEGLSPFVTQRRFILTNNITHLKQADGTLKPLYAKHRPSSSVSPLLLRVAFLTVALIGAVAVFVLWKKENRQLNKERE